MIVLFAWLDLQLGSYSVFACMHTTACCNKTQFVPLVNCNFAYVYGNVTCKHAVSGEDDLEDARIIDVPEAFATFSRVCRGLFASILNSILIYFVIIV